MQTLYALGIQTHVMKPLRELNVKNVKFNACLRIASVRVRKNWSQDFGIGQVENYELSISRVRKRWQTNVL